MRVIRLESIPPQPRTIRAIPVVSGRIESTDLFQDDRRIRIAHGDQVYTLTLTSKNTLILTK
jgi:hemin uptake protein HemP